MTKQKPYGTWSSPLTPAAMAGGMPLREVGWAGDGETVVWVESRGGDGCVVARRFDDAQWDVSGEKSVRGGVGYGGGELCVHGETAYFAASDGRLYRVDLSEGWPTPITPDWEGGAASPAVAPQGDRALFVHTDGQQDCLAVVDTEGANWPQKLVTGSDFYMQPTWGPDGERIAWVEWDHPNMPWDETRLCTAEVRRAHGRLTIAERQTLRSPEQVSLFGPTFSPDGEHLAYASDEDGWWHLYVRNMQTAETRRLTDGEVEMAGPAWVQGMRWFDWDPSGRRLLAVRNDRGRMDLMRVDLEGNAEVVEAIDEYDAIRQPAVSSSGRVAFIGSAPDTPERIVTWAPGEEERVERRSSGERIGDERLADLETTAWTVLDDGVEQEVYGNYYPPTNPDFEATGRPPAILMVHGGPTSQHPAEYEGRAQFFATRGWAVLDVNYRGSTGYGRDYRDALKGKWGEADVQDVVAGGEYLIDEGLADPERLVVMGGSAGGYTVLQSLVNHPGFFAAGISMYGISNLFSLAMDTHKFEQHYNDSLVGALPEAGDLFRERSPIFHADQIADPVGVFQGAEDKVVPKAQSDEIVESLKQRGIPHTYEVYDNEGHGWRQPETIEKFYQSVLGFLKKHVLFQ
jgi:dipeptidyl aminopeptidase/acylaminoacyl peptidase